MKKKVKILATIEQGSPLINIPYHEEDKNKERIWAKRPKDDIER